jgi:hypothetical protein
MGLKEETQLKLHHDLWGLPSHLFLLPLLQSLPSLFLSLHSHLHSPLPFFPWFCGHVLHFERPEKYLVTPHLFFTAMRVWDSEQVQGICQGLGAEDLHLLRSRLVKLQRLNFG